MPVPIGDVLGILADNLVKRQSALPLSGKQSSGWARGLGIPAGGETVLYTGQMYQLVPRISSMARQLARFENSSITRYFGVGRAVNKVINLSRFMTHAEADERQVSDDILRNIARLLRAAGVDFGYMYERERYSGALLYDEGVDDAFESHAERLYWMLRDNGVKQIITVDPHTTNMLRSVYPKLIHGYKLKVRSYLEVLAERRLSPVRQLDSELVIHDSCVYARSENVVDEPRMLLRNGGANVREPELSGRLTHCCGGPLESLFPGKAHDLAARRIKQFAGCGDQVVTMCPVCMSHLKRASGPEITVSDISEYLAAMYCPADSQNNPV